MSRKPKPKPKPVTSLAQAESALDELEGILNGSRGPGEKALAQAFLGMILDYLDTSGRLPEGEKHKHKCERCGFIWEHDNEVAGEPDEIRHCAHTCPGCGEIEQTLIYQGSSAPECVNHHKGKECSGST